MTGGEGDAKAGLGTGEEAVLEVRGLSAGFDTEAGRVRAVDGVSFQVRGGETLGIVGESGCGKSVTALSIMRLLPQPMGHILGGEVLYRGRDLVRVSAEAMHAVRGAGIGMVFQEPMTALNPVHRVGAQLSEVLLLHTKLNRREAWSQSVEILGRVGIPSPEIRATEYPHQLSGGMRQRVMIAMALACGPDVLIADEPTTALDVTVQAQILRLIGDLREQMGMAVILITHDLGVIAQTCDEVAVMYAGRIVERAQATALFERPRHPYTQGLLDAIPRADRPRKSRLRTIEGMVPGLEDLPAGCRFASRCPRPHGNEVLEERPPFLEAASGHWIEACPCFYPASNGGECSR